MHIICLNVWKGRMFKELSTFIHNNPADIYCFQEVLSCSSKINHEGMQLNLLQKLQDLLPNHQAHFVPAVQCNVGGHTVEYGIAMFTRVKMETFSALIHHDTKPGLKNQTKHVQWGFVGNVMVAHFHGLWTGGDKNDCEQRRLQSKKINKILTDTCVLMGDFNYDIDIEPLQILEHNKINLIKKYNIKTTRSKQYTGTWKYADYCIVTPNVTVQEFYVDPTECSDHLALRLEI